MSKKKQSVTVIEEAVVTETAVVEAVVETAAVEIPAELQKKQRGRKIDPTSVRQLKFNQKQELLDAGIIITRGRKVNAESERQKRLEGYALKMAAGIPVKRGRPKKVVINQEPVMEVAPA